MRARWLMMILGGLVLACALESAAPVAEPSKVSAEVWSSTRPPEAMDGRGVDAPVVIVTVDGVRWQEIFGGSDPKLSGAPGVPAAVLFPNLTKVGVERGVAVGAPGLGTISASGPNFLSLPGYTEIFSGRPPAFCLDNSCARTTMPTLLDEARANGAKVAVFSAWSALCRATTPYTDAFLLSCGTAGSAAVDPWPGHDVDYRPDRLTATDALTYLERERPDVLFIGLGDPDEHAHEGDYPGYLAAIRHADETIGRLYAALDRMGERGRETHVMITADHGREHAFRHHGATPEAARVWLLASGPRFAARGAVRSERDRHLADIAPTLRVVLGLAPDVSASAGSPMSELFGAAVR